MVTVSTLALDRVKDKPPRTGDGVWVPVYTEVELVANLDRQETTNEYLGSLFQLDSVWFKMMVNATDNNGAHIPCHQGGQNSHAVEDNPGRKH